MHQAMEKRWCKNTGTCLSSHKILCDAEKVVVSGHIYNESRQSQQRTEVSGNIFRQFRSFFQTAKSNLKNCDKCFKCGVECKK